ncbi:MAG: LiaF transmembrane domain-containing protein [Anaerolineales bacterium]|jgi:hypothetical protein
MNLNHYEPETKHYGIEGRIFQIITGLAIVLFGVTYLLSQTGWIDFPFNWWALFILMPAVGFLFAAYHTYRRSGNRLTVAFAIQGLLALIVGGLAVSLFFGYYPPINWGAIWPLFVILVGISILFGKHR